MDDLYVRQDSLELNVNQSIAVIGCGGIGFWVCKFAAMSGIKKIYAFDPDIAEKHNFNRIDLPYLKFIGKNKADMVKIVIEALRPDCNVYTYPYKFSEIHGLFMSDVDWLIDCTDNFESQENNQKIALSNNMRYLKAGYNGTRISISDSIAMWGNAPDRYTVIPSWVSPAVIVAAMVIVKIMKYEDKEMGCDIEKLFI